MVVFASTASSRSLMKASQVFCSSSCSVVSAGSCKSSQAGEVKVGILGNLDKGSTLEWALPGQCMMTISGKAAKTSPHAASLRFAFSYVFAHVNAEWSVTRSTFSPSMKGWKCTRLSLAANASLSMAEYLFSTGASTLLQYAMQPLFLQVLGYFPSFCSTRALDDDRRALWIVSQRVPELFHPFCTVRIISYEFEYPLSP